MGRGTLIAFVVTAAVVASFSACNPTETVGSGRPDGGAVCLPGGEACPQGFSCANRNCVPTCPGGSGCDTGSYCEGPTAPRDVCAPLQTTACVGDNQCPLPQVCFSGLCSAREGLYDGGSAPCLQRYPDDHCAPDAICVATTNYGIACLGMPACGQDGTCPVGGYGSVCNDLEDGGVMNPGKQRICLFGYCRSAANCPQSPTTTQCFRGSLAVPYGECQLGGHGDPCFSNSDCPQEAAGCHGADGGLDDGGTPGRCGCVGADGGLLDAGTSCP